MSLLIPRLEKEFGAENVYVVHSGQHYSWELNGVFFEELALRKPNEHLEMPQNLKQGEQTAYVMSKIEPILEKEKPNIVLSFSDANPSVFAITASKNRIKVAHIESGMRSYDWRMPEEKNRRVVDAISDYLFTPTEISERNLIKEGHDKERIFLTSKLIFDVIENYEKNWERSEILETLSLEKEKYFLVTLHRPENVEDREKLTSILKGIKEIYEKYQMPIVAPLHPRTQSAITRFGLEYFVRQPRFHLLNPIGFFDFTKLERYAYCIITDSGTVEEDACWFKVPCITTRISTERPETVEVGANIIVGQGDGNFNPIRILDAVKEMTDREKNWKIPYSQGATNKITKILKQKEDEIMKPKIWW